MKYASVPKFVPGMKYHRRFSPYIELPVQSGDCLYPVITTYALAMGGRYHQCNRNQGHGEGGLFCRVHAHRMEKMK